MLRGATASEISQHFVSNYVSEVCKVVAIFGEKNLVNCTLHSTLCRALMQGKKHNIPTRQTQMLIPYLTLTPAAMQKKEGLN